MRADQADELVAGVDRHYKVSRALGASPLVAAGEDGPPDRPLRLVGTALYLVRLNGTSVSARILGN